MNDEWLERFVEQIQEGTKRNDEELTDPDDDWQAMMFALVPCTDKEDHDHEAMGDPGPPYYDFGLIALDPQFLSDDDHKDELAEKVMPSVLAQIREKAGGIGAAAYLASTWMVKADKSWPKEMIEMAYPEEGSKAPRVMPSDHPWRTEALTLLVITADQEFMYVAEIHRDERRVPYLQEWEKVGTDADPISGMSGRFYEGLCKGVRGEEAPKG